MTYRLSAPPVVADLQTHAAAITTNAFKVSYKTMADWPIEMHLVNGKRQPEPCEVWAYATVLMGDDLAPAILGRMSDALRSAVEDRLPSARVAKASFDAAIKRKRGRGAHLKSAQ